MHVGFKQKFIYLTVIHVVSDLNNALVSLIPKVVKNRSIKKLALGKNFFSMKTRYRFELCYLNITAYYNK